MSWTAIIVLAAGAYLFKALGLAVLGPMAAAGAEPGDDSTAAASDGGWFLRVGQLLPPALLAALVVNQTVTDGQQLVVDARLAGVAAGAVAVGRGAPFWLVLIISAAVTATLRAITG